MKNLFNRLFVKIGFGLALLASVAGLISDIDVIANAIDSVNPFNDTNKEISINLGMPLSEVTRVLGEPDEIKGVELLYFSDGIKITNDYEFRELVGGVVVEKLPSGISYKGKVNGVSLKQSFDSVKEELGKPTYWAIESEDESTAIWLKEDLVTIIRFSETRQGDRIASSIMYSKQSSMLTYETIVKASIQGLKAGRVPEFLKEYEFKNNDADYMSGKGKVSIARYLKDYLYMDYKFVGMVPNNFGGAFVLLEFTNGETLNFWVYPRGWVKPAVISITNMDEYYEE